ncbi:MAG: hypothetical protein H6860_06350 [Rhodospirillales bacterium]|nr:hypothetical protein [Alphaproteobacteria bacterium]MCB9982002.1 hypothetical protein [Rhodospirillales bacterium]
MKLLIEYNKQHFWAKGRWVYRNPDLFMTELDTFLKEEWLKVIQFVSKEEKCVALVDVCRNRGEQQYGLRGIVLPKSFLIQYGDVFPEQDDTVTDLSSITFKNNPDFYLGTICNKGFLGVNAFHEKKRFIIAGSWLCTYLTIDKNHQAVISYEPEETLDIEKTVFTARSSSLGQSPKGLEPGDV